MGDNLIIYYSRKGQNYVNGQIRELEKGNSELVAEYIRDAVGGDLFQVETVKEYPADYTECTEAAKAELKSRARPQLRHYLSDLSGYRNIFIVGPCWWGTYPTAMFSLLEKLDFSGKHVYPVMTHEGSGAGSSERDLKKTCKGAVLARSFTVQGSMVPKSGAQITAWAQKLPL